MRIARRKNLHEELAIAEGAIGRDQVAVGGHALVQFGNVFLAHPVARGFGDVLIAGHVPGDVVLHVGAVGDVVVDEEIGHPGVERAQPGAHFGRVGLHVIAIEIQALGGGFGGEGAVLGDDQGDHGAAFGRGADVHHFDEARCAFQAVRDFHGFGVGSCFVPAGFLAGGEKVLRRILGAGGQRRGLLGGGRFGCGVRGDGSCARSRARRHVSSMMCMLAYET